MIGGGEAQGICGSGLIDATACLLRAGIVNRAGNFSRSHGRAEIVLKKGDKMIVLRKGDIDLLQRAKAAIGAATQCLVNRAGMKMKDIKRICVSGAFGSYLDVGNAQAIGLLPQAEIETVELCGNTALSGCRALLLRGASTVYDLKARAVIVNMSSLPEFEEKFITNLYLGPMNPD